MTKLPVLQPKELFSFACAEDVSEMPEEGAGHYCGSCEKTVVDLSRCTYAEAVATLRSAKKGTCVSYSVAHDGRLVFRDLLKGTVVVTVAAFLAACASPELAQLPDERLLLAPVASAESSTRPASTRPASESTSGEERDPRPIEVSPAENHLQDTAGARWPGAVSETPPQPPVVKPSRGRPELPPRPLAGKPVQLPEPRQFAGGMREVGE